ncbi:universal stress protein UspA-like protein [Rivularia sp. PCC 7116]|uniref:universal stress protein n=1 Tax=Rivularia sp. PCC 7116 TaxID=373994 RepID=UPI00029F269C|nr:universal stress protein [Rivularia sp. PCC 7116]AFY55501.1 universal stress protein UspA-like protein [Rivularia sp. PCC 7116]
MFTKILVSIDNSDMTQHIVDEAVSLAKATSANLMFLHVICPLDEPYFDPLFMQPTILYSELHKETQKKNLKEWEEFKQNKENWLLDLCESATSAGVKAEYTLNIGDPSNRICDFAGSWNADVIVIGRRGHRGFTELFLGSVSNYVMHHAPCSVLTVQGPILSTSAASQTQDIETKPAN